MVVYQYGKDISDEEFKKKNILLGRMFLKTDCCAYLS